VFVCIVEGFLLSSQYSLIAIIPRSYIMTSPSFDIFQDNFSFRNLGYGLLRCALATMIVVAAAFLIWCLPTALTWLQQTLAVYGMTVSVDVAWTVTLLQSALVFSAALVVWTIDGVVQAWQQGPTVDWSADQLIVVPEAESGKGESLGKNSTSHLDKYTGEDVRSMDVRKSTGSTQGVPSNYPRWDAYSYYMSYGEGGHPLDIVDDQVDQAAYDGLTKPVNRRLIFDPIKRVCRVSHGSVQTVTAPVIQTLSQQLMKPGLPKNNGLHLWLQKWLQSGVLSYSQKVLAYQLWLSTVPVPGNYLRQPAQVATEAFRVRQKTKVLSTVVLDSNHAGDKNIKSANLIENGDSTNFELDASSTTPVAPASSEKNILSIETSPSQKVLSANTQDDKGWWEESLWRLFRSPNDNDANDASTNPGAETSEDFTGTPIASKKRRLSENSETTPLFNEIPSGSVSISRGVLAMLRTLGDIMGGGSPERGLSASPDSQNHRSVVPSYGTFSGNHLLRSMEQEKVLGESLDPITPYRMDRSPLPSSPFANAVPVNGGDRNDWFAGGLLGSPINFTASPSDSPNQEGSPFNNVAFMTREDMLVIKQSSDSLSRYYEEILGSSALKIQQDGGYDLSQAQEIIGGTGLEWQQDSRDDIDLLAVDLDAGLQCGQTISPIMLGNSSLFVETKGEGDPACETSLDDIDEVFSGISIIKNGS